MTSQDNVTINIRRYTRRVYLQIAEALQQLVEGNELDVERRLLVRRMRRYRTKVKRTMFGLRAGWGHTVIAITFGRSGCSLSTASTG